MAVSTSLIFALQVLFWLSSLYGAIDLVKAHTDHGDLLDPCGATLGIINDGLDLKLADFVLRDVHGYGMPLSGTDIYHLT